MKMNRKELLSLLEKNIENWSLRKREEIFRSPEILSEFDGLVALYGRVRFLDMPFTVHTDTGDGRFVTIEYFEPGVEGGFIPRTVKLQKEESLETTGMEHLEKKIPPAAYKN